MTDHPAIYPQRWQANRSTNVAALYAGAAADTTREFVAASPVGVVGINSAGVREFVAAGIAINEVED